MFWILCINLQTCLQVFAYTKRSQIMSDDNCLDASNIVGPVSLIRCHGLEGNQAWVYDSKVNLLNTFYYWYVIE